MKSSDLLILAALGAAAYWLYNNVAAPIGAAAGAVKQAFQTTGDALGSGLYEMLNPGAVGSTIDYIATFPDGSKHAVPNTIINGDGTFTAPVAATAYAGQTMQLVVGASGTTQPTLAVYPTMNFASNAANSLTSMLLTAIP